MVTTLSWERSYRIVHARYAATNVFDRIADPADLESILAVEARTDPRVRDELGELALVRAADRISGPGTSAIMTAFTHGKRSRFSDGSFGVYYAARERPTAIAETVYHVERLYAATRERSADIDMQVLTAQVAGRFDDLLALGGDDPRLDPNSYAASAAYGRARYEGNRVDGMTYPSVRDPERRPCVAAFRPRSMSACRPGERLVYRWDGPVQAIVSVAEVSAA